MPAPGPRGMLPAQALKDDLSFSTARSDGYGGVLNAKQQDRFIQYIQEAGVLPNIFEMKRLEQAEGLLEMAGFTGQISLPRTEYETIDETDRAKLTRSKAAFNCKDFGAEVWISKKFLRNNIMKQRLRQYSMEELARKIAPELDAYLLNSATGHSDSNYQSFDGILEQCTVEVVNNSGSSQTINDTPFENLRIQLMTADSGRSYWDETNPNNMIYLMNPADRSAYRKSLHSKTAERGYELREKDITKLMYEGAEIRGLHCMPAGTMLCTRRDNYVIAMEEEPRYDWDEMKRYDAWALLAFYSIDVKIKFANGAAKCTDLDTPTVSTG